METAGEVGSTMVSMNERVALRRQQLRQARLHRAFLAHELQLWEREGPRYGN